MLPNCNFGKKMFKIANTINATGFITNMLAFNPPSKPMYKINQLDKKEAKEKLIRGDCFDIKYEQVEFISELASDLNYPWIKEECYCVQRVKKMSSYKKLNGNDRKKSDETLNFNGKKIVVLIIKVKNAKNNIIFSHGNSSTIGTMYPYLLDLATQLKSNIICYDYQGYGHSQGSSSEQNLYHDMENVIQFLKNLKSISLNDSKHDTSSENSFILIGHSLGSAPSVHIASKYCCRSSLIRAIILISPIASSLKFFEKSNSSTKNNIGIEKIDVFCNIKKIQEVNCPVFIIHGKKDEIIRVSQSEEMLKYVKIHYEWFPKNGNHCNILTKYRTKFITKCKIFLDNLDCFEGKKNNISKFSLDNSFAMMHTKTWNKNSNDPYSVENRNRKNNIGSISPFQNMNMPPFDCSGYNASERRGSYRLYNNNLFSADVSEFIGVRARAYENDLEFDCVDESSDIHNQPESNFCNVNIDQGNDSSYNNKYLGVDVSYQESANLNDNACFNYNNGNNNYGRQINNHKENYIHGLSDLNLGEISDEDYFNGNINKNYYYVFDKYGSNDRMTNNKIMNTRISNENGRFSNFSESSPNLDLFRNDNKIENKLKDNGSAESRNKEYDDCVFETKDKLHKLTNHEPHAYNERAGFDNANNCHRNSGLIDN